MAKKPTIKLTPDQRIAQLEKTIKLLSKNSKNSKTSDSMKEYWANKKNADELADKIRDANQSKMVAIGSYRDNLITAFTNLDPGLIYNVLYGYQASGDLTLISDFFDYMIDSDTQIAALIQARTQKIRSENLIVSAKNKEPYANEAADFIRNIFDDGIPDFDKVIRQLLMGVFKMVAVGEIIYKKPDPITSIVGIREISMIPMKKIKIRLNPVTESGERYNTDITIPYGDFIYGLNMYGDTGQAAPIDMESLAPGKFIVHSPGDEINLALRGLLRKVAWIWFFKRAAMAFYLAGSEAFSYPFLVAKVNKFAEENAKQELANLIKNARGMTGITIDSDSSIESINPGSSGGGNIWQGLINQFNAEQSKVLIGGSVLLENPTSTNAKQIAIVQESALNNITLTDANALAQTLREQLVVPLLKENLHLFGGVMPPIPRLKFDISTPQEIPQYMYDYGLIKKNEARSSIKLTPLSSEEGGDDFIKVGADPMLSAFTQDRVMNERKALALVNGNNFDGASTYFEGKEDEQ